MRIPTMIFALIATTLVGTTHATMAQSAYSYPWCATYSWAGVTSCYFATWEQCMTTISGIGGICYRSPYYQPLAAIGAPRSAASRHRSN